MKDSELQWDRLYTLCTLVQIVTKLCVFVVRIIRLGTCLKGVQPFRKESVIQIKYVIRKVHIIHILYMHDMMIAKFL